MKSGASVLLGEPKQTDFDLNFLCLGIPVRIHPGFWAIAALLSLPIGREPLPVLGFASAIFLSILIHELGHALAFRKCGIRSHIVLYHFGGLAAPDSISNYVGFGKDYSSRSKIFVTAMGPGVQLLSAILLVILLRGLGKTDGFVTRFIGVPAHWTADPMGVLNEIEQVEGSLLPFRAIPEFATVYQARLRLADTNQDGLITQQELSDYESRIDASEPLAVPAWESLEPLPEVLEPIRRYVPRDMVEHFTGAAQEALLRADDGEGKLILWSSVRLRHQASVEIENEFLRVFVFGFVQVGLFWAVMNLIPVYPLDGGQITRELFVLSGTPNAVIKSLKVSIVCGVISGLIGLQMQMMFIAIMFLMLAYSSYQTLQRMVGRYF